MAGWLLGAGSCHRRGAPRNDAMQSLPDRTLGCPEMRHSRISQQIRLFVYYVGWRLSACLAYFLLPLLLTRLPGTRIVRSNGQFIFDGEEHESAFSDAVEKLNEFLKESWTVGGPYTVWCLKEVEPRLFLTVNTCALDAATVEKLGADLIVGATIYYTYMDRKWDAKRRSNYLLDERRSARKKTLAQMTELQCSESSKRMIEFLSRNLRWTGWRERLSDIVDAKDCPPDQPV